MTGKRASDSSWPDEEGHAQPTFRQFRPRQSTFFLPNRPRTDVEVEALRASNLNTCRATVYLDLDSDEETDTRKSEAQSHSPAPAEVIDIEALDEKFQQEADLELQGPSSTTFLPCLGCAPVTLPWVQLSNYVFGEKLKGLAKPKTNLLKTGECVELRNGSFLHIDMVIQNLHTDEIVLRGWKLVRTRELRGLLPKKVNELCFVFEHLLDDTRSVWQQNLVEVKIQDVCRHRELIRTNYPFPALRYKEEDTMISADKYVCLRFTESHLGLVVRWKFTTSYNNATQRSRLLKYPLHVRQRKLEALVKEECSGYECYALPDHLRATYRPIPVAEVQTEENAKTNGKAERNTQASVKTQLYTFGDAFCGAGGTTCGAKAAGFQIKWGLDLAENASKTWVENFPEADHYQMTAFDMIGRQSLPEQYLVDCLHLSPPCQVWSPVHTREGKNDEMNFAALFACEELLKNAMPRFVTLEQTFGILHPKFTPSFNALIKMFTDHGYSTSWQILEFQRYGLAQSRRRCIIVAAGPGETLPAIPEYTHSDKPVQDNLRPYTSAWSVLDSVPRNARNHNVAEAFAGNNNKYRPWDATGIIPCITCDGGTFGYPNGSRGLTHREIAALQSFPHTHVFMGKEIKKQIGNAFASMIAKTVLYQPILRHLKATDRVREEVIDLSD